jgi:hypothetical protein
MIGDLLKIMQSFVVDVALGLTKSSTTFMG